MTNAFTAFAFNASGSNQFARTLPARLADVKNVKDFGATGLGFPHDDWAAIMAAFNALAGPTGNTGTVYFPPGTYFVSQPIAWNGNQNPIFLGSLGLSIITGNFADYVFSQTGGNANGTVFDGLTVVNANATGGGIRLGGTIGGAIRNCAITANQGYQYFCQRLRANILWFCWEISIENCTLSPGSNRSGSQGLMLLADGPVRNCKVSNYHIGCLTAGGEFGQNFMGCYFELCDTALLPGIGPNGAGDAGGIEMSGCWFKNNSIAINFSVSCACAIFGVRIEGTNGQAPGGLNPQYGILSGTGGGGGLLGVALLAGITIIGQYDIAGVYLFAQSFYLNPQYMSVQVSNSGAGSVWHLDNGTGRYFGEFINCGGTGMPYIPTVAAIPAAQLEGDTVNVSDGTNSLAWGAPVTNTGTHTTHYLVRWNGSNWTVMGQ